MLSILGNAARACDGVTRRATLQAGGAGMLGMSLAKVLAAKSLQPADIQPRAKSVLVVFL